MPRHERPDPFVGADVNRRTAAGSSVTTTAVLALVLTAACATLRGSASEGTSFRTNLPVDSALRIAATQLQIHGYTIGVRGQNMIMTDPRAVPQDLRAARAKRPVRRWVLRVDATRVLLGGTDIRVAGFLVPAGASGKGNPPEGAKRVDEEDRQLFSEVRAVAGWVRDAAQRKARSS